MSGVIDPVAGYYTQSGAVSDGDRTDEIVIARRGVTHLLLAASSTSAVNTPVELQLQARYEPSGTWFYVSSHTDGTPTPRVRWGAYGSSLIDGSSNLAVIGTFAPNGTSGLGSAYPRQMRYCPIWMFHSIRFEFQLAAGLNDVGLVLTPIFVRLPWGG